MLNKICIYNNKIFVALDTYLIAYAYKKYPKSVGEKFLECFKIKLPVKCMYLNDIRLEVIENCITGLKSLVILLFDLKGVCSVFIYCSGFRKKLYQIVLPNLAVAVESCSTNLFVCDGPAFLFHSSNTFHFLSVPYGMNNSTDCQFLFFGSEEYKILQFNCFGPFENDFCQRCLFLLIASCNFSCQQRIKVVGFVSETNKPINYEQLSLHFFFPQCYEDVLKAIQVTKVVPAFKAEVLSIKDMEWKETASVICTKNDCFVFSNAILKYCCKLTLPLSNVMCMKAEFSNTCSENLNLVLTFENKTVFFIKMKKDINCEVVKHWTDIEATITGEVLMKGSKQVLLLKQTDGDSWQNSCILYDMSSFTPVDILCHSAMPDNCLKTTISGLEKKVRIGKSAIKDIEHEISEKSAATIDALSKLNECRVNTESLKCSYVFQESLVDLILSKDENKLENIPLESESSIKLLDKKQLFMDNQRIISLCFINEGGRSICNPSIKVLMKDREVACIQKLFIYSSDNHFFSCEYSRQVNPKTKFSIVLSFEFSVLHVEDDVIMILCWYNGSTDEFDNEVFINEDKKILIQNQICIQSRITLTDVLQHETKRDISSLGDLLFVRALQQRMNLRISSLHSDVSRLEEMLKKNESGCTYLKLFESPSTKCITFNNDTSLLFGVHLIVLKSRRNAVEIQAFTRNEREVCLLVHNLYQHLPEDIIISPCLKFKDEFLELKKNVAICIKNETDMLISSLNIYNISEEMRKSYTKLVSSQTVGTITIPKVTYQRIRTVLVKKECITDTKFKTIC